MLRNNVFTQPQDPFVIVRDTIFPGEYKQVKMNAGKLPSGTRIDVVAHVFRSKNPGPCILAVAGIHGDEINGVEIVKHYSKTNDTNWLKCGSFIAIPLLNIFGFINFSREVPDGKDVNRSFPGNTAGSLASRVARILTKKILPYVDIVLDFHTGGGSRYNYPQVRYSTHDEESEKLAKIFGTTFMISKSMIQGSLRKTTKSLNIPTVVYEGGESVRLDGYVISKGIKGIKNILRHYKMIDFDMPKAKKHIIRCSKTSWLRSPASGIFLWTRQSGQYIDIGDVLGTISSPFGTQETKIYSKKRGYILGHNNSSVINQGDALFHIATGYEMV